MRPLTDGMWVVQDNRRVGILFFSKATGQMEFHETDKLGNTTHCGPMIGVFRQARHSEIPESRRPSRELGRLLGYD